MNSRKLFSLAQLAEASYAFLEGTINNQDLLKERLIRQDLEEVDKYEFSLTQADEFIQNWKVVSHQPNTESGFSATLFQYIGNDPNSGYTNGELVYAVRGTELGIFNPDDLASDIGDIVVDGLAVNQIVDMYNDWKRITAGTDQPYQAAILKTDLALTAQRALLPIGGTDAFDASFAALGYLIDLPTGTVQKIEFAWSNEVFSDSRAYGNFDINVAQLSDVTGHSLGGHLASAFTRLFPGYADALTINGAGYPTGLVDGLSGNAASNITNLFASLGGSNQFDSSSIYNIYGEKNLEFITMHNQLGLVQQGSTDSLFIEQPTPIAAGFGHSSTQMTNSLAVANLFIRLDSTLAGKAPQQVLAQLNAIFEKSSNIANQSLEKTVTGLRQIILGEQSPMTIETDIREQLYASISTLQNSDLFAALEGKVELAASPGIATEARNDFGAFLSLFYLTPFALKATNAEANNVLLAIHTALGDKWTDDYNLSDEAMQNGEANFSQEWLADRIAVLKWKNELAEEDFVDVNGFGYPSNGGLPTYYEDRASDLAFNIGIGIGDRKQVVFGSSSVEPDNISGGNKDDRLYGMGGDDIISGGNGNDYLEGNDGSDTLNGGLGADILVGGKGVDILDGGDGNDQLKGGAGADVYQFNGVFGTDVITDGDGQGSLIADSNPLIGGDKKLENIYKHEGTGYIYTKVNGGNTVVITKESSTNRIIVQNWSEDKDLNIKLNGDLPPPPEATPGLTGDFKKKIDDHGTASTDDDTYVMTDGNYTRDETALNGEPGAADLISGTDAVAGIGGKDVIYGLGGDDALSGKSGDDYIDGGSGSDVIQAGLGKDTIYGGDGDDIIYGSSDQVLIKPTDVGFGKPINTYVNPQGSGFNWTSGYTSTLENGVPSIFHDSQRNRLEGDDGNLIDGGIGNDFIAAGTGTDSVRGGEGKDLIFGMDKDDILFGDGDNDYIYGDGDKQSSTSVVWSLPNNHGNDVIDGGDGDDVLLGQGKSDIIFGGNNNDKIWGDDRNQTLLDGAYHGNDYIDGGSGNDQIRGGGGDDQIFGGSENDLIWGDSETETLLSGSYHGNDYIEGGEGNDTLLGGGKDDTVIGGIGNDFLWGDLSALDSTGKYHGNDLLEGGDGNDQLLGGGRNDTLLGGNGDDLLLGDDQYPISGGYYGNDYLNGGDGSDTLKGGSGGDTLFGGAGSDRLEGEDGHDYLDGGTGADYLIGGSGNDTLIGGGQGILSADGIFTGGDNLEGGIGNDTYYAGAGDYINDTQGINTFIVNGVKASDIQMSTVVTDAGLTLAVNLGSADKTVFIENALTENAIANYIFDDESSIEHAELVGNTLITAVNLITTSTNVAYGGLNNDVLTARNSTSTATLSGGGGNDVLSGNAGNDVLKGGAGNDTMSGGAGADQMLGGAGADVMSGNAGDDNYFVDDVADQVLENAGEGLDTVESSVDFTISNRNEIEKLILTGSAVAATGNDLDNYITGNDSNNILTGNGGDDELFGGLGDDTYVLSIGDGADAIDDLQGFNTISFGNGITRDSLQVSQYQGNDGSYYLYIQYGPGSDSVAIRGGLTGTIQKYEFDDGSVVSHAELIGSEELPFKIIGTSDSDTLWGGNGNDIVEGDQGNDELFGLIGNDSLNGGAGLDILSGGDGNDLLDGGIGNDQLQGGAGTDTYLMYWGTGRDSASDGENEEVNEVKLETGISFSDLAMHREGNDLFLHFKGDEEDGLLIKDYYIKSQQWNLRNSAGETLTIADFIVNDVPTAGTLIEQAIEQYESRAKAQYYRSLVQAGFRVGPDGLMQKTVAEINDDNTTIYTYVDRYVVSRQISDGPEISRVTPQYNSNQTLVSFQETYASNYLGKGSSNSISTFVSGESALAPQPFFIPKNGTNLPVGYKVPLGSAAITTPNGIWIYPGSNNSSSSASGTVSTPRPYVTQHYQDDGTTTFESIKAGNSSNTIYIEAFDDRFGDPEDNSGHGVEFYLSIDAGKGDDVIQVDGPERYIDIWKDEFAERNFSYTYKNFGAFLYGNDGNDTVLGASGDDTIIGGNGDDYLNGAYGADTYYIFADESGNDLIEDTDHVTSFGSDGVSVDFYMDWYYRSIGINDWFNKYVNGEPLPVLPFVKPTDFAEMEELAQAGLFDQDTVEFGPGIAMADLNFSWGQLAGESPVEEFDDMGLFNSHITGTLDISWGEDAHLRLAIPVISSGQATHPASQWLLGAGIERLKFADGTVYSLADIAKLIPPPSSETIEFSLGMGQKTISYLWKSELEFSANVKPDDICVSRDGLDLLLSHSNETDQLRITDWFLESDSPPLITANFGSSYQEWDAATLTQLSMYQATNGDDHLVGNAENNIIYGGRGNDVIEGGAGNDELHGGYDNDILNAGTGNEDYLYGEAGDDVLNANTTASLYADGGDGNDTIYGGDGYDYLYGGDGDDVLNSVNSAYVHADGGDGNDLIMAGEFNDELQGGSGNDTLMAGAGDDFLVGGGGNDSLFGGLGDDEYSFNDVFLVNDAADIDYISDIGGVDTLWVGYQQFFGPEVISLVLTGNTLVVRIEGLDGQVNIHWSPELGYAIEKFKFWNGTTWNFEEILSHIQQGGTNDADMLTGGAGADTINGGQGNDTINAGGGDDYIEGGSGDDLLIGGAGDDTYQFDQGDGTDVINDSSGIDTLQFGYGISESTLSLGLGSLLVKVGNSGDAIHIEGFKQNDVYGSGTVERFRFYNGLELSYEQLLTRGFDISGDDAANAITGTNIQDRIYGLAGDDVIASGVGDDLLDGGSGNDLLQGGDGSDTYIFGAGSGIDVIEDANGLYDKVVLQEGISPDDLEIAQEGDYIVLGLKNASDKLSIRWYDSENSKIETIEFADGTSWDATTLENLGVPPNSAPIIANPFVDQQILEDAVFSYSIAGVFEDPDSEDALSYSSSLENGDPLPPWLSFDSDTLTFSGTPENANVGSLTLTVTTTDQAGAFVSSSFNIDVANTNDAPVVANAIADQATDEDAVFSFRVPADTFADVDLGDTLTYSASLADGSALPGWISFDAQTQTFSGVPENADVGSLSLQVTATDIAGAAVSSDFNVTVNNTNDAPILNGFIPNQTAYEGQTFSLQVNEDLFADVDLNDELSYSATLMDDNALPAWLNFDATNLVFTGMPGNEDVGSWQVQLIAIDLAGASTSTLFTLDLPRSPDQVLVGDSEANMLAGGTGHDTINGMDGSDELYGGAGNDTLNGGGGSDLLSAGSGNDILEFNADGLQILPIFTYNHGSPGNPGSGDAAFAILHWTSKDSFDGGTGTDTLNGTSGWDFITLDDQNGEARITGIEAIYAGAEHDVVNLTSTQNSYGDIYINGEDGNDVLWSNQGLDVLQGGSGWDQLDSGAGKGLLDGGQNSDLLRGGDVSDFFIGGEDNDTIITGGGQDVIAFNVGDGVDSVYSTSDADNTISLGGNIDYADLSLKKSGKDLVLKVSNRDRIVLQDWYESGPSVATLQVIAEAMQGFNPGGSNTLLDNKIETFDFGAIVNRFDEARAARPFINNWSIADALLDFHLGGSDSAALGGDLAYQYGKTGALAGTSVAAVHSIIADSSFGQSAQALQPLAALREGLVKLS